MNDDTSGTSSTTDPKTDWRRLRSMTDKEIHAAILNDPDAKPTDEDFWKEARVVLPRRKETVTMRLDADLLEWFRRERGYQTRINAILRAYMNAHVDDRSSAVMTKAPAPSSVYKLFAQAMTSRNQVLCTYDGYLRELCPVILGHTNGQEMALAYQFAGQSKSGLPPRGQWKCLSLSKVGNVQLRDGPWHTGSSHTKPQHCVQEVDLDVNPASPYNPKRRVGPRGRGRALPE
jgi:uncharacterized protein (DUF4415 family)